MIDVAARFHEMVARVKKAEAEMFPSTKLFRTMLTGFCLWLAVVMQRDFHHGGGGFV